MRKTRIIILLAAALVARNAHAATLSIGLSDDPDLLDPARSISYTDRIVFASVCDKLIDVSPDGTFIPQLATDWQWSPDGHALTIHLRDGVKFQDGTAMDADAVKTNLERYRSAPESARKSELKPITAIDVVDARTIRLELAAPTAPLVALLADRSGMIMSPKALAAAGANIGQHPVCAGPFAFNSRVAQDHITFDRFADYWDAKSIGVDRIVFRPIPDTTTRLVNLQSGQLQMIERMAPNDVATVRANPHLRVVTHTALAYRTIEINLAHGAGASSPLAKSPLVREAFEKSLDRGVINQVVMNGLFVPNNQMEAPTSRYWNPDHPVPARDLDGARALLKQAGIEHPAFTLQLANNPVDAQTGQVIQSMAAEAGFDIRLQQLEINALNQATLSGDFQAALLIWSGRPDPDGNVSIWLTCDGFTNYGRYCNPKVDALLAQGRTLTDAAARVPIYRQVADLYLADRPQIVLFHYTWLYGISDRLHGFVPNADGLIRPQGITLVP